MALALCPGPPFGPLRLGARTRLPKSLATWRSPQRRVERLRRSFAGEPLRSSRLSRCCCVLSGLKTHRSQNTSVSEHKLIDRQTFFD